MADTLLFVQAQTFSLSGAGCALGDTSIILKSFAQIDGTLLAMTDFGTIGFGTLEPNNSTKEEQISFTGVTQNGNGTATLTGVKTVGFVSPYTATSGVAQSHPGGASFVISNTAGFYDRMTSKQNDETITGTYTFTTPNFPKMSDSTTLPTTDAQLVNKKYVDDRNGYWEGAVATYAALPTGSTTGEVRVVLSPLSIYIWTGAAWTVFSADPIVTTPAYYLGSGSTGTDYRTFPLGATIADNNNVHVFRQGYRVAYGSSADYTIVGTNVVFNYDVLADDVITVLIIQ